MVALRLIHVARLTLDHRHTKSTHARNRHALRSIETFAMAKRGSAAEKLPIEPPSLDTQDASALRTFIESMISAGAIAALVSWLLALLTRLWKTQNDLLERVRSRKRRNGDNEKLARLQALLPGIDWSTPANDAAAAPEGKPKDKRKDKRKRGNNPNRDEHGRARFAAHLERREEVLPVPSAQRGCVRCGIEMTLKEWIAREILEKIPAQFFVRLILRERLQCPCCRAECVSAEPAGVIRTKGSLGVDLVVDALVDHVEDAVPFERIARKAKAQGVELAANTLASSVHAAIDHLDLIANEVFRRTMISHVVGIDATSMPTLDPKARGGIRRMALWNLLGDGLYSSFGVASSGHGDKLKALLKGHSLQVLQCDGSPAINEVQRVSVVRAGCHSHARSKLVDALKTGDARAAAGLSLYADLFAVEAESRRLREQHPERLQRRAIHSGPLIARLWAWVDAMRPQVEPRSPLGAALTYMTRQRATLEVFLKDGRVAMTNNAVERELRTYVLDRKTWLFCGHAKNAERIAAALTIVRTCKLHGIDSRAYLRVVLRRILAGERDITKLWMTNVQGELASTRAA